MIKLLNQMLVQRDGSVWGNIDMDSNNNYKYNTCVSIYNQGTYIGACKMLYDYIHKSEYLEMEKNATKSATKISEILDGKDNAGYLIVLKQFWLDDLGNLLEI